MNILKIWSWGSLFKAVTHKTPAFLTTPIAYFKTPRKGTKDHERKKSLDLVRPP